MFLPLIWMRRRTSALESQGRMPPLAIVRLNRYQIRPWIRCDSSKVYQILPHVSNSWEEEESILNVRIYCQHYPRADNKVGIPHPCPSDSESLLSWAKGAKPNTHVSRIRTHVEKPMKIVKSIRKQPLHWSVMIWVTAEGCSNVKYKPRRERNRKKPVGFSPFLKKRM
jgi:hypothetical protein